MTDRVPHRGLERRVSHGREIFTGTWRPLRWSKRARHRGEGRLTKDGALLVDTGKFTGRSVKDKFVVRDATTEDTINWGAINQPMTPEHWANLKADFLAALKDQEELYVADLFGGSQPEYRVNVRVINQMAWHNLFVRTLLVRRQLTSSPASRPNTRSSTCPASRPIRRATAAAATR